MGDPTKLSNTGVSTRRRLAAPEADMRRSISLERFRKR
jgi:hypothetical protein